MADDDSQDTQDVTVWLAWRVAPSARLVATLSPDEHMRAHRYRDPADADAFRWSRGLQRILLGARLVLPPESLRFVQDGDAKPVLDADGHARCEYNASHSGTLFALAISDAPVGVDIEQARAMPNLAKVARRVFDGSVASAIIGAPDGRRRAAFFAEWTMLEAHAKLHGQGVWRILSERGRHGAAEQVRTAALETPDGYFGAVAVAGSTPLITVRWADPETAS